MIPVSPLKRSEWMLQAVKAGLRPDWVPLTVHRGQDELVVEVSRLPLMFEGVFLGMSALDQEAMGAVMDALLPTPLLFDQMWAQRTLTLPPLPQDYRTLQELSAMEAHSSAVLTALYDAGAHPASRPFPIGKTWTICKGIPQHPKYAATVGFHVERSAVDARKLYKGMETHPTTTGVEGLLVQKVEWAHLLEFWDYSQVGWFVRNPCKLNGKEDRLDRVLRDPAHAGLASHEGPLPEVHYRLR